MANQGYEADYLQVDSGPTKLYRRLILSGSYLDSPATTSSTTYKTQSRLQNTSGSASSTFQQTGADSVASIILMEIGA